MYELKMIRRCFITTFDY